MAKVSASIPADATTQMNAVIDNCCGSHCLNISFPEVYIDILTVGVDIFHVHSVFHPMLVGCSLRLAWKLLAPV